MTEKETQKTESQTENASAKSACTDCKATSEEAVSQEKASASGTTAPPQSPTTAKSQQSDPKAPTSNKKPAPPPPPTETRWGIPLADPDMLASQRRRGRLFVSFALFLTFALAFGVTGEWFIRSVLLQNRHGGVDAIAPANNPQTR